MSNAIILIPARSGSTRVKNKNIKLLGGKPLIGHVISSAVASGIGRVILSTDSVEIAGIARSFGAETPFLRPVELSSSDAPSIWVILDAVKWLIENEKHTPDYIAYCPPTNPFIKPETIKEMYKNLGDGHGVNSIVTITKPKTHPFRIVQKQKNGILQIGAVSVCDKNIKDIERSQDWPEVWEGSPACRMTKSNFFLDLLNKKQNTLSAVTGKTYDVDNCIGYEIDNFEATDIDDEEDWIMVERMLNL